MENIDQNVSINDFDFREVHDRWWIAMQNLYQYDDYLIRHSLWEVTISHRIAFYLEEQLRGWHVDCEYNRAGTGPKLAKALRYSRRPDIVVHRRGKGGPNLIAVEIKKQPRINLEDRGKAIRYVKELNYRWAICIGIGRKECVCEWQGDIVKSSKTWRLNDIHVEEQCCFAFP